jgi:membrane-associated phospholipid phosphatase
MTMSTRSITASTLLVLTMAAGASPARAQSQASAAPVASNDEAPSVGQLFTETLSSFARVPTLANLGWLAVGGIAALETHPADAETTRALSGATALNEPFKAGAVLGGTPFEVGAALLTYGIGRARHDGRTARVGADLLQAQLIAETLTFAVKEVARRQRPSGSGYSFPSGHTSVTFASATVLQHHFGWKVGVPAYAVAAYVATSRIQNRRHYLSDVAFGAALGLVSGRVVTLKPHRGVVVAPIATPGGAGVALSWTDRPPPRR